MQILGEIRLYNEKTLGKNTEKHLTVTIGKSLKLIFGKSLRVLPTVPTPWPCVIPQSDQILSPRQQKGFLYSKKRKHVFRKFYNLLGGRHPVGDEKPHNRRNRLDCLLHRCWVKIADRIRLVGLGPASGLGFSRQNVTPESSTLDFFPKKKQTVRFFFHQNNFQDLGLNLHTNHWFWWALGILTNRKTDTNEGAA